MFGIRLHTNAMILDAIKSHFDRLLAEGLDCYGDQATPMWMASLDTRTGRYPVCDERPESVGKRVYRNIDAPRGCSFYWDQPSLVAAHALTRLTGDACYADAADAYARAFLARCTARNGVFLWGNHYYYDAFRDQTLRFVSDEEPVPVNMQTENGELHEIRPLTPAWETIWRVDPDATARAILVAARGHLVNPETGEFQRHAEGTTGCAFLEAGGILIESLAWLFARCGDRSLLPLADCMAGYSFRHRGPDTGLLENNPTWTRWDKIASTNEVGLWAGCLARAASYADRAEWTALAQEALSAWVSRAWDPSAERFFGRLEVATGKAILGPKETPYQPGDYSDIWEPLFPAHDYPMPCAEACLLLYRQSGNPVFRIACERWIRQIEQSLPARHGQGGYAEHYGRCLHFLLGCHHTWTDSGYEALARRIASEALETLFEYGMFRGHPGENRYDAVDGVGFLALALLWYETGKEPPGMGLSW